ncbi:MAG TPA: glycoside hydrolase family 3 N-terminal domain-containing protein, partial [Bryobacteraceae bacterium]
MDYTRKWFPIFLLAFALEAQPPQDQALQKRVLDLVRRMTLEEKVSQMQNHSAAIPRLGIPEYDWWNEGLHGIARSGYATVFPQAIGLAATWDTALLHTVATTISTEARAKYNEAIRRNIHSIYYGLTIWSPNINIFRDPRWGRGQETYGEDPYLTSRLGVAFVTGLQGDDPQYLKTVATPKHFAVHSGPESDRHRFNVSPSPFDLEDTYLPAFRATVMEGRADSVMCAYNALNGVPACASRELLGTILRNHWQFNGYVTSDCGAVSDFFSRDGHHYSPDRAHAAAAAVLAGTDTSCGTEYAALVDAVKQGLISEDAINTAVERLFLARFRLGLFDPAANVPYAKIPFSENDSAAHRALALEAGRKSIVLLKNQNNTLPLRGNIKTIAVIGPNAASLAALEGNYNGVPSHPILPVDGIEQEFQGRAKILYAQGSPYATGVSLPVPRTALHPARGSESGLTGEYFNNAELRGKPVLTRLDKQVDFDWNSASPAPDIPANDFGVRWTGTLTPPKIGDYSFDLSFAHCYPCYSRES